MYITRLELKNFRNYESLEADFDEKINLILGNNAQGKTNLIESIYMTSIGRSFRAAKDSDVIMFGRDEALIKVNAEKKFSGTEVEIRIKGASKKSVKKDGIPLKKSSELLENIMIVIFSPEDMKIVKVLLKKSTKEFDSEYSYISGDEYDAILDFEIPQGITITCTSPTQLTISGADKQLVGQTAQNIRVYRKPEPYKGKGIKFEGEYIRRKEGKKK